ncbi:MAG: hypothetical protein EAZ37_12025 [Burkholderiales bacterium]|nr:MAG: hypothetical protein EAZ37_12025 [Burkholderiales bacterium]
MNVIEKPIVVFGDESHSNEIVTFAYVIVPAVKMATLDLALKEVKNRYGLPEDARIHCRNMFNADARAKTVFATFSTEQVLRFLFDLMSVSFDSGVRGWVGYLNTQNAPDAIRMGAWEGPDSDKLNGSLRDTWDVSSLKNRMMLSYYAATVLLSSAVPHSKVSAFIDGDKTKIPHMDMRRRKVDGLRSFFGLDTNDSRFEPETVHGIKPLQLDLADLLAYAAARALSKVVLKSKSEFSSIVNVIRPAYCEVVFSGNDPNGHAMRFQAYDHAVDEIKSYINQFV